MCVHARVHFVCMQMCGCSCSWMCIHMGLRPKVNAGCIPGYFSLSLLRRMVALAGRCSWSS